jgi:hypothetical protein
MGDEQEAGEAAGAPEKRLSITKKQLQSDSAVELVALCQTVTADGTLSEVEVGELQRWLNDHRGADFPAIAFLTSTVEKITSDRRITVEERKALHEALEAVLPPEIRRSAKGKRLEVERLARAQRKVDERLAREQARAEAERDSPIESFDFMVAGVQYEGRSVYVERYARAGDSIKLAREPTNRFSRNAIQVRLTGDQQIGYVLEEDAAVLAPLLDGKHPYEAKIKKVLTEGKVPRPVVVVDVFRKDAKVEGVEYASTREAAASSGVNLVWTLLLILIAAFIGYCTFT